MVSSETAGPGACMLLMYNQGLRNNLSVLSEKVACKQMHGVYSGEVKHYSSFEKNEFTVL